MEGVEFTEERAISSPSVRTPVLHQSMFVRVLMQSGFVTSEKQANILLVIFALLMIVTALFVFWRGNATETIDISSSEYGRVMEGLSR